MAKDEGRGLLLWIIGLTVFFLGFSLIEIKAMNPATISTFERIFWWVCLIVWAFAGGMVIITKVRQKGGEN